MKANRLTNARLVAALKVGRKAWLSDDESIRNRGRLLARISNQTAPLYYFRYSISGQYRYIPLGPHSAEPRDGYLTLDQARTEAARLSALYRSSETREVREALTQRARLPAAPAPSIHLALDTTQASEADLSLLALVELYCAQLKADGKTSARQMAGVVRRSLAPSVISTKAASAVTPDDIVEVLRPVIARNKREASKLRAAIHAAFEAAMRYRFDPQCLPGWKPFVITANPVRAVGKINCHGTRDRNLSGRELGLLWLHLNEGESADSIAYRFLRLDILLGGQRCEQLLRVKLSEIDEYDRTITLWDGKGLRARPRKHALPLSDLAWQEISSLIQIANAQGSDFLFSGRRNGSAATANNISHVTSDIGNAMAKLKFDDRPMEPFSYGDLRRTTESRMVDLDISKDMRAQLLSHGLSGIQETHYDRNLHLRQKRESLVVWEAYVLRMADEQRLSYSQAIRARAASLTPACRQ